MVTEKSAPGKFSTYLAVTSFLIGTLFLILYLAFPNYSPGIIYIGYVFVLVAAILNSISLLFLLWQLAIYRFYRETTTIRILIVLANIPVALLYLNIVYQAII